MLLHKPPANPDPTKIYLEDGRIIDKPKSKRGLNLIPYQYKKGQSGNPGGQFKVRKVNADR